MDIAADDVEDALVVARLHRTALDHLGVDARPVLLGDGGVQVWIPVARRYTSAQADQWAGELATAIRSTVPDLADVAPRQRPSSRSPRSACARRRAGPSPCRSRGPSSTRRRRRGPSATSASASSGRVIRWLRSSASSSACRGCEPALVVAPAAGRGSGPAAAGVLLPAWSRSTQLQPGADLAGVEVGGDGAAGEVVQRHDHASVPLVAQGEHLGRPGVEHCGSRPTRSRAAPCAGGSAARTS